MKYLYVAMEPPRSSGCGSWWTTGTWTKLPSKSNPINRYDVTKGAAQLERAPNGNWVAWSHIETITTQRDDARAMVRTCRDTLLRMAHPAAALCKCRTCILYKQLDKWLSDNE